MSGMRTANLRQFMGALNGTPEKLGNLTTAGATAVDQTSTAVPFTVDVGELLMVQGDQDFYVLPVATAGAVTGGATGTGVLVRAGDLFYLQMEDSKPLLSVIRSSADVNVKVWRLR